MELDQVDDVHAQPAAALLDAAKDTVAGVVLHDLAIGPTAGSMAAALGGQEELVSPGRQKATDALLAAVVEGGGVDEVEPRVQGVVQGSLDVLVVSIHVAVLGGAQAESRDFQARLAESAAFHAVILHNAYRRGSSQRTVWHTLVPVSVGSMW